MTLKPGDEIKPLVFSTDFNDPDLGTVLMWHISLCPPCQAAMWQQPPVANGKPSRMCREYQEIIQEYSEYEGQYAMRGNP